MKGEDYMFPTSKKEVEALGWDYIDVILFTGDAFIDHPSFGTAVIARWLQKHGYRVAVVPQPNWRDDLRGQFRSDGFHGEPLYGGKAPSPRRRLHS